MECIDLGQASDDDLEDFDEMMGDCLLCVWTLSRLSLTLWEEVLRSLFTP